MKHIFFLAFTIIVATALNAQKILSTKTGSISFFSSATLEDIEAKNSEVESKLLTTNGQVVFSLLIKGFRFDNQMMEDHFNENYLESAKFPKSTFKGFITNIKEIDFSKDGTYPAKVSGDLTLHGVTKKITTNGTIAVKNGKAAAKSKFNIKLKDYGIGGTMIGSKIAENISITVDCQY